MRVGGPFPFGSGVEQVAIASGGCYYPAPGNYIANLGATTVLQVYDPQTLEWRNYGMPWSTSLPFSTDGFNWRLVNMSGVVQGAVITNAGSGGTNGIGPTATGVTIGFGAAPTNGRVAQAYAIVGGAINSTVTVTQAGSGFLVPPRIVFDPPPPGGERATAIAVMAAGTGTIASITVTNPGAGYTVAPKAYVVPQPSIYQGAAIGSIGPGAVPAPGLVAAGSVLPGSGVQPAPGTTGALLTVNATLAGSGTLTGICMVDNGGNYLGTAIPSISFTGGGLAGGVAATAVMGFSLTSVTLGGGGAGYGAGAPPGFQTTLGAIVTTASLYRDNINNLMIARPARGTTTVGAGAVATFVIEDPGFGLQSVPNVEVINTSALATGQATGTAVVGGITDISFLQNAAQ